MDFRAKKEQIIGNINYLNGQLALIKELEDECSSEQTEGPPKESPTTPSTEG